MKREKKEFILPAFVLFQKKGQGYLQFADWAITAANLSFAQVHRWLNAIDEGKWNQETGFKLENVGWLAYDIFEMYAAWTEADAYLLYINKLSDNERKKHLALDKHLDLEKVKKEFVILSGAIMGAEERHPEIYEQELNRQLHQRVDTWEKALAWAEKDPLHRPEDPTQDDIDEPRDDHSIRFIGEFYGYRDMLEWAMLGLFKCAFVTVGDAKRKVRRRLQSIDTNFLWDKLDELDDRFEAVLHGRRGLEAFWFEDEFWWHHKPDDVKDAEEDVE